MNITIPELPPSVNALYKRSLNGGLYLNPKANAFKASVILILEKLDFVIIDKPVKLEIVFTVTKANIDIDNLLKVLLDSLNKKIYTDDKLVYELNVKKVIGKIKETKITVSIL